jgi:hypothetical protein
MTSHEWQPSVFLNGDIAEKIAVLAPYKRLAEVEHSLLLKLGGRIKRLRTSKGYTRCDCFGCALFVFRIVDRDTCANEAYRSAIAFPNAPGPTGRQGNLVPKICHD